MIIYKIILIKMKSDIIILLNKMDTYYITKIQTLTIIIITILYVLVLVAFLSK